MKKKAIVMGTGSFGELVQFYLDNDSDYQVVAFCETNPKGNEFSSVPLISFEEIEKIYPSEECEMFVAIGYRKMNAMRKEFCEQARSKGYKLLSYVSSKTTYWNKANKIGGNVFIFEDNTIQPFVEIGEGTILWSGNHIGHHSQLGRYCFITSHVVISGHCQIGDYSFLGVNSTVIDGVNIESKNLIGAGALITKNTRINEVYIGQRAAILNQSIDRVF